MSETQIDPSWWLASDGRWYPPQPPQPLQAIQPPAYAPPYPPNAVPGSPAQPALAAPFGPDRCRFCGRGPTVIAKFGKQIGMIIVRQQTIIAGPMCRNCGLSTGRSFQASTILLGWWGVFSFLLNPFVIFNNFRSSRRIKQLAQPADPALAQPLNIGRPLWQRPAMLVPLAFLVAVGWTIHQEMLLKPVEDLIVGDCISNDMNYGEVPTRDCSDDHDAEVIGVIEARDIDDGDFSAACARVAATVLGDSSDRPVVRVAYFRIMTSTPAKVICVVASQDGTPLTTSVLPG